MDIESMQNIIAATDGDGKNNNSIIQSHPPKRLQRLLESASPPPTLEELEGKLASAEVRRNQVMIVFFSSFNYVLIWTISKIMRTNFQYVFEILAERTNSIRSKLDDGLNSLENHMNDLETTIDSEIEQASDKLNEMLDGAGKTISNLIPNELKNIVGDEEESNDANNEENDVDEPPADEPNEPQQQSDEDNSNKW